MALEGLRVGVTAHRKGRELAEALTRRGAVVCHGPTPGGDVPVPVARTLADTDRITAARPRWLVASTGVGVRLWVQVAADHGRLEALRATAAAARCVARGAKAVGGLQALDVTPVWTSQRQTDRDVAGWLAEQVQPGDAVAVQLHGTATTAPFAALERAGAQLLPVATYQHAFPEDLDPARELIAAVLADELDVVTFTSPGAVRNLFAIAEADAPQRGAAVAAAFQERVAVAAIGPVTASALEELGVPVWIAPQRWRTGDLLRILDRWASDREARPVTPPRLRLVPERHAVVVADGAEVQLDRRDYAVLAALARRPGIVCPPEQLLVEAWGHRAPSDPDAIAHQVARLRRELAGTDVTIVTVDDVGYRLDGTATP